MKGDEGEAVRSGSGVRRWLASGEKTDAPTKTPFLLRSHVPRITGEAGVRVRGPILRLGQPALRSRRRRRLEGARLRMRGVDVSN